MPRLGGVCAPTGSKEGRLPAFAVRGVVPAEGKICAEKSTGEASAGTDASPVFYGPICRTTWVCHRRHSSEKREALAAVVTVGSAASALPVIVAFAGRDAAPSVPAFADWPAVFALVDVPYPAELAASGVLAAVCCRAFPAAAGISDLAWRCRCLEQPDVPLQADHSGGCKSWSRCSRCGHLFRCGRHFPPGALRLHSHALRRCHGNRLVWLLQP